MKKLLSIIVLAVGVALTAGCGAARSSVKVTNNASHTSTTVSVSGVQGGNTSVTVSPDVQVNVEFPNQVKGQ